MHAAVLWQRLRQLARTSRVLTSLRVRLILLVLMAVLPALALIILNAVQLRQAGIDQAEESTLRIVRTTANQHQHLLESTRQLLLTLSQLRQVQRHDRETCQLTFDNLRALHPVYGEIGAFDLRGNLIATSSDATNPPSASLRQFVQETARRKQFAMGEYQVDSETRKALLPLAHPVFDRSGDLQAVVFASLNLSWIIDLFPFLNLPPNSSFTVFDRHGMTLVRFPDDRFVGQVLPRVPTDRLRQEGVGPIRSRDGTWRLYAYKILGQDTPSPALISVGIPLAAAYAPANRMLWRNLLFLGIVAIFALTAAWIGGQVLILRRIQGLVRATQRLAAGDLRARINLPYRTGEIGQLERAFDSMADSLETRVAERQQAEDQLKNLNEQLEGRVTERTLELRRSNEDLEQFASVASHDLQEPLRMVTSYLQLLEQRYSSQLDHKAREFVGFAIDGAARMQLLIRDLLTFSRVSTRDHPFEQVDCEEILQTALANLQLAVRETGATLTHDPLPTVPGNRTLLTQLFQNLLSNALKFRGPEPPHIHVGALRDGQQWHFTVQDNGIGIALEHFDRVFALFQRLHARETYPGTGIGLAVCKKIVERHHGRIWVESTPGQGATFHFTLAA